MSPTVCFRKLIPLGVNSINRSRSLRNDAKSLTRKTSVWVNSISAVPVKLSSETPDLSKFAEVLTV